MNEVPRGAASAAHLLDGGQQRRGLPVALAAEAVAVGHQPLHGQAGELAQPAEVLEVRGEGAEPPVEQERAQPGLDPGGVAQRRVPLAAPLELRREAVGVGVLGHQRVDVGVGDRVDLRHQVVDAVGVHRDAEAQLGLDLVALGDGDVAHVVAEAGQRAGRRGGRGPRRRGSSRRRAAPAPDRPRAPRPSCGAPPAGPRRARTRGRRARPG